MLHRFNPKLEDQLTNFSVLDRCSCGESSQFIWSNTSVKYVERFSQRGAEQEHKQTLVPFLEDRLQIVLASGGGGILEPFLINNKKVSRMILTKNSDKDTYHFKF